MQGKAGNKNLPFYSLTIEVDAKHLIKESGYEELPILVGRLLKLIGETQGRSLGMDALPDILEANIVMEALTVAIEKSLDPPLGVYSDGVLGGGEIDTSAGAINVFNPADQAKDRAPIFQLFTVGEFKQTVALLEMLSQKISDHFLIDRLLDFNNETRMTLGEVNIRDRMRGASLGSIYRRQISSYFTPAVERVFREALARGRLGLTQDQADKQGGLKPGQRLIPATIAKLMADGEDVFDIKYFTPAMRVMQAEEAEGIIQTVELAKSLVELKGPQASDSINADVTLELFRDTQGAPSEMFFSKAEVKKQRAEDSASQEVLEEGDAAQQEAETLRAMGNSGLMDTTKPKEAS